jgi:hypothetical protein
MDIKKAEELYANYNREYSEFMKGKHADVSDAFGKSIDFMRLVDAADSVGLKLYDHWAPPSADFPKVVFIINPRMKHYDKEISDFLNMTVNKKIITDKDCVLIEGPNGEIDYRQPTNEIEGKFCFKFKSNSINYQGKCDVSEYIAKIYQSLKTNDIPIYFNDNLKKGDAFLEARKRMNSFENKKKEGINVGNSIENALVEMMENLVGRSKCFIEGIEANLDKRRIFQIFSFANYAIESTHFALGDKRISYAVFIPRYKN